MKTRYKVLISCFFIVAPVIGSCTEKDTSQMSTSGFPWLSPTATELQTTIPLTTTRPASTEYGSTPTRVPANTDDILVSETPTSTPTLTPLPMRTQTGTSTPIPVLSEEEARLKLQELMATNGNCQLPCIWGITPGESTGPESQARLKPLTRISDLSDFQRSLGTISPNYQEGNLLITGNIAFLANEVVDRIHFEWRVFEPYEDVPNNIYGLNMVFNSEYFGNLTSRYSLSSILSEYDRPTSVYLFTYPRIPPEPYGQEHFMLLLLYPIQGFLVHYSTEMRVEGPNVIGCFTSAHFEMELLAPGGSTPFISRLEPSWRDKIQNGYIPLEEATSMSIDDFYETYRNSENPCLSTPANLWPEPEGGGG